MGGGGNTAIFVTNDGVVLVDTKIKGYGQDILAKVREITDKPGHDDHQHAHPLGPHGREHGVSRYGRRHRRLV